MDFVKRLVWFSLLACGIATAQVTPVVQSGTIQGNNTGTMAAPGPIGIPTYYVQTPVSTATISAAGNQACSAGGGIVQIPVGTFKAASLGGTITGGFPVCQTASVIYSGAGFGYGGTGGAAFEYGTIFELDGTFGLYQYNATDCGGGTCIEPTNGATFIAGMLAGGGLQNMTIIGGLNSVKVGSLYEPGSVHGWYSNLNILNDAGWGFWAENFWGQTIFNNIKVSGSTLGQIVLCSSAGTANQNGNSYAYNLYGSSASNINSIGVRICARGLNGTLNNFVAHGILSLEESHTAVTASATVASTTAAVTPTNGNPAIALASQPFLNGQPVIFATSSGSGSGTSVTAGTVYYVVNAFSSNFGVAATVGGTPITFSCSGTCASSTISSPAMYITSYAAFPVDAEVVVTGTVTNSAFLTRQTYYVVYNARYSGGSTGFIELANYPGGTAVTPATGTGAVSGLSVKNFGPSPLEVWGYGQPGSGNNAEVLPGAIDNLDLETNGGTVNAALNIAGVRDTNFTSSGYIVLGSTATYVVRSINGVCVNFIADAQQVIDAIPGDFSLPCVTGSRSVPGSTNSSNVVGVGFTQVNPDFGGNFPRSSGGAGMLNLSGLASYDIGWNNPNAFIDFQNFAIGFATYDVPNSTVLVPGQGTSNISCPTSGNNGITLPTIAANGDGEFLLIDNPSTGTCTLTGGGSQNIVAAGSSANTYVIAAETMAICKSVNNSSLYWACR
jgi:hypothetical protein